MSFLFVHGAGDPRAEDGSFRLLERIKVALNLPDEKCTAPILTRPNTPDGDVWRDEIGAKIKGLENRSTILAHSFGGCCTLAALAAFPVEQHVARLVLVAVPHWGKDPDWPASSFTLDTDYAARLGEIDSIDLVYSEDDDVVPVSHMNFYLEELASAQSYLLNGTGHTFINGNISVIEKLVNEGLTGI